MKKSDPADSNARLDVPNSRPLKYGSSGSTSACTRRPRCWHRRGTDQTDPERPHHADRSSARALRLTGAKVGLCDVQSRPPCGTTISRSYWHSFSPACLRGACPFINSRYESSHCRSIKRSFGRRVASCAQFDNPISRRSGDEYANESRDRPSTGGRRDPEYCRLYPHGGMQWRTCQPDVPKWRVCRQHRRK